ncbi:MAG: M48 family metallopeptidase [Pyrinomonadaceae bacterium]
MNKRLFGKRIAVAAMAMTMWILPFAAMAQTRITAPKNKYKVQDDVKLGNQAAAEVEKQFPLINDSDAAAYIERVGQRLVNSIPRQFAQPAFNYRFKWVNASDINAFALPGGPMYVNRGMIDAARNEGELAGVMAHEITHVALRHATAQATKQGSAKNTLGTIGLILGGAILGGQTGAQLGALGAQAWMTKYSREYETQADTLGAQIMADAGYDPRDLANVFQTIANQDRGGGTPEWLSSHPDPGNRYEKINRETTYLRVSANPIKITRDFERIQARFRALPKARTMAEIEKSAQTGQGTENPTASGRYSNSVQYPSSSVRAYSGVNWLRLNVPSNWREFSSTDGVQFAPEGAYGDQGITRGVMIGIFRGQNNDLQTDSESYVNQVLQGNSYLQQRTRFTQTNVAGRQGYTTSASGRSPLTGKTEVINIYTTQLRSGELFYAVTVVPDDESYNYSNAFRNVLSSIRLND